MNNWKEFTLGDIIKFGNGKERPKTVGIIPIFGGNGILGYCDKSNYNDETIIIGRVGAYCGSVFYQNNSIWISDNALSAKPKTNFNTKFLFYFLKNLRLNYFAEGSSHPLVTQSLLNSIEVFITDSISEQNNIAEILSSLDDKIDLLHRQNKTLEQIAETLFRQWFVEEADDGWEEKKFEDILDLQRGISYTSKSLGEYGNGIPMHNLNSIDIYGRYKYEGIKYYTGEIKEKQKLVAGDLLIINTDITQDNRIIGWPIFVPDNYSESVCTHHLYSVLLNTEKVTKLYLYFLLRHREYREELANASNGTTVSMLSKNAIGNVKIKIPPEIKRKDFESIVSELMAKQTLNQKQIQTLTKLKDTLLPKLMSGEVKV